MKLLGGTEQSRETQVQSQRAQDDAAVGYGFQRHPNEVEFPHYDKQSRWASGDDAIIEVNFFAPLASFKGVSSCQKKKIFFN